MMVSPVPMAEQYPQFDPMQRVTKFKTYSKKVFIGGIPAGTKSGRFGLVCFFLLLLPLTHVWFRDSVGELLALREGDRGLAEEAPDSGGSPEWLRVRGVR
jgi:hypothetical protein